MRLLGSLLLGCVTTSTFIGSCLAQKPSAYKDAETGIEFTTWNIPSEEKSGGFTFGMALPGDALEKDATEFIGYINYTADGKSASKGWSGIALGGAMTNGLLLVAYPDGNDMRTSLRFTKKYAMPGVYTGKATVHQIAHKVEPSGYSLIFHCEGCLRWSQGGITGNASTSSGNLDLGFAYSSKAPGHPGCSKELALKQHEQQGTWTAVLQKSAASSSYGEWKGMAKPGPKDEC